ncbi:MAG: hypothetical protein KatS3mg083_110 [Candidatus Dojkabacteria bacterium]|nr:MAG: hypothetical protein KatS3mg083_110 [Candidatus Dojkabacteria bacterium]
MEEDGYNRGPFIDSCNKRYAYLGAPYCASAMSVILDRIKARCPSYRGGASRNFLRGNCERIEAEDIFYGKVSPRKINYTIAVFKRNGGGHVEYVDHYCNKNQKIYCFGFNTTPVGRVGSLWNGRYSLWNYRSLRSSISPYNSFRITHFVYIK